MPKEYDAIIIGAGAAGLFCAHQLSKAGASVLVLEKQDRVGRKLLLSGGGKCNITNLEVSCENYIGQNPAFCEHALNAFKPQDILNFLYSHRIQVQEREHKQIFCRSNVHELRDLFLALCGNKGVDFVLNQPRLNIGRYNANFAVQGTAEIYLAPNLIIATGSPAWPRCGASDFGHRLAMQMGHKIIPLFPALAPMTMPSDWPLHGLAGITIPVSISLPDLLPDCPVFNLPLLFTHGGISGPAVLQISSYWQREQAVNINFLPEHKCEELFEQEGAGKLLLANLLARHLPPRLIAALLPSEITGRKVAELSRGDRNLITESVHVHSVLPLPTSFEKAEACRGGVNTAEICSETLESKVSPGLYFIGEVLDVCGQLGGYNLQWAWSSAYACAVGLAKKIALASKDSNPNSK